MRPTGPASCYHSCSSLGPTCQQVMWRLYCHAWQGLWEEGVWRESRCVCVCVGRWCGPQPLKARHLGGQVGNGPAENGCIAESRLCCVIISALLLAQNLTFVAVDCVH
jgi:hypothetical protein